MKKTLTLAAAALAMAGTLAVSAGSAEAKFGRRGAFFGGVIGGLAIGAIATHGYHYGPSCYFRTKRVWDPYYGWTFRQVRVCY